jgi:hypothetical protein
MTGKAARSRQSRIALLTCVLTTTIASPSFALRREAYSVEVVLSMAGQLERSKAPCATLAPCWVSVGQRVLVTIYAYPTQNTSFVHSAGSADRDDYGLCTGALFLQVPSKQNRVALRVCRLDPPKTGVGTLYIKIIH